MMKPKMRKHLDHFITSFINWRFRIRPLTAGLFAAGIACLGYALAGGIGIRGSIPTANGSLSFDLSTGGGAPDFLIWSSGLLGLGLIATASFFTYSNFQREQRALDRKRTVIVELRGLRDGVGTPLSDSVVGAGAKEVLLLDVRQGVQDGFIVDPVRAVERLSRVRDDLAQREQGRERSDLSRVFGGLAPVPLTFLTGVLIDDEEDINIRDWSRHERSWKALEETDNGARFEIEGLGNLPTIVKDVALLVSTSYDLDYSGIDKMIRDMPRVRMRLADAGSDAHWSEEKQKALGKQFFETLQKIGNRGTQRIHLFLAAQSSIVFRFGALYDKRNLPVLLVYQYERASDPPYPWAVKMPVGESNRATVEFFDAEKA
jgi:hypothetical protein